MARRYELSEAISKQLKEELNTVIPVGAGVKRALDRMSRDGWGGVERLVNTLRRIPPKMLENMLKRSERFLEYRERYKDCPVSLAERRELVGDMPWAVFVTMARVVADPELSTEEVTKRLEETSNFGPLKEILHRRFVDRGHILRCYRIVNDARRMLREVEYTYLPQRKREIHQEEERLEQFVSLIRQAGGNSTVRKDLEDFVCRHLDVNARVDELEKVHAELSEEFDELHHQLMQYNADFDALQKLEESDHRFSEAELDELRPLLGLYGTEVEKRLPPGKANAGYVHERMLYWGVKMEQAPFGSARQIVAEQAHTRYGIIYAELLT